MILPRQCVPHFFEVIYVFNDFRMKDYPWTDLDRNIADTLSIYWTNFAKARDPNGPGLTHWPIYNPKDEFLNINDTVRLERFNSAGIDLIAGFSRGVTPRSIGSLTQSALTEHRAIDRDSPARAPRKI